MKKNYMEIIKDAIREDKIIELLYNTDENGVIIDSPTELNIMIDLCVYYNIDIIKFLNGEIPRDVIDLLLIKLSIEENFDEIIEAIYCKEIEDKKNAMKKKIIDLDKFRH